MSKIRRTYWNEHPSKQMVEVDEEGVFIGSTVYRTCFHAPALDIDFDASVMSGGGFQFLRINGPRARVKLVNKLLRLLVHYEFIPEAGSVCAGDPESMIALPMIAFDVPLELVPSSTPGHYHLYIEQLMDWENYRVLLSALLGANVIHRKFYDLSMRLKQTVLLKPGFTKADLRQKNGGSGSVDYGLSYG